jgi:hypothetical protein
VPDARSGLVCQEKILDDPPIARRYEEWIDPRLHLARHRRVALSRHTRCAHEVAAMVVFIGRLSGELKALGLGMGWGTWCRMAKALGRDAYGSEVSPSRIAPAWSQGVTVLAWEEMLGYGFDLINAEQVSEHVPEPTETLVHVREAPSPEGIIRISVLSGDRLGRRIASADWQRPRSHGPIELVRPLEHINCFRRSSLLAMASRAGLRPVNTSLPKQLTCLPDLLDRSVLANQVLEPIYSDLSRKGTCVFLRHQGAGGDRGPGSGPES